MSMPTSPPRVQPLRPELIRPFFPALHIRAPGEAPPIFLDAPGGTQVPEPVLRAMAEYLWQGSANTGGAFRTSRKTDRLIAQARQAAADLVGAADPREIVFGPNMTSLTFRAAQAVGRVLAPGDEVVVTRLDHDANVAPWRTLRLRGVQIRELDFEPEDCTLRLERLEELLGPRTRLVAVGLASNAVGTVNPVRAIAERAKLAGALTFVDAVHFAPHGLLDVAALGCDFLVCSAYKFFGPYLGLMWGRPDLLAGLPVAKVRPAPDTAPERWETGTKDHTSLAGLIATVDYLADLGEGVEEAPEPDGPSGAPLLDPVRSAAEGLVRPHPERERSLGFAARELAGSRPREGRRTRLTRAFEALGRHERELSRHLLEGLGSVPGLRIWGITDPGRLAERVPTYSFTLRGWRAEELAARLGERGIACWAGDFYAPSVVQRLGLQPSGGLVRVGAVHYNTRSEINVLVAALQELAGGGASPDRGTTA
jgi:cysteine desulfurase family protein (TIGR01976 family)